MGTNKSKDTYPALRPEGTPMVINNGRRTIVLQDPPRVEKVWKECGRTVPAKRSKAQVPQRLAALQGYSKAPSPSKLV